MKKKFNILQLFLLIVGAIGIVWMVIYFYPVAEKEKSSFFENNRPLVMAHQGGAALAPSSTMTAFHQAVSLGVDVIEFDVHMTKDGKLIAIHDPTVDRTTDGEGVVSEMTLEEIQVLDAGAKFVDDNGEFPYRNKGIYIPTVEEIFTEIPNMRWNIEVKDTNKPDDYLVIVRKLWELIEEYGLQNDVLLASFDQEIVELIQEVSNGDALIAGGRSEITKFVLLHKLFLNGLYHTNIDAIEIPTEESGINLVDEKLIQSARDRGIDIHYWTINDKEMMRELLDYGVDGILTDRPDLLIQILEERGF